MGREKGENRGEGEWISNNQTVGKGKEEMYNSPKAEKRVHNQT